MDLAKADVPSNDLLGVIFTLVPGFLAAWVFYGLTAHPKKTPFERTIQALIFTLFVQGMNYGVQGILEWLPNKGRQRWGTWNDGEIVWSAINAVVIGVVFATFANRNWLHNVLNKIGVTKRTSFPSEWFSAFNRHQRHVVLHLKGQRRLKGWPEEWPDQCDSGHFVIDGPTWILPDNTLAPVYQVERLLIPTTEVEMVEIVRNEEEVVATAEQKQAVMDRLVELQQEDDNGKQGTTTSTECVRSEVDDGETAGIKRRVEAGHAPAAPTQKAVNQRRKKGRR